MTKMISVNLAGTILIAMMILLIAMHVLIMLRVIPYDIVWGGQIKDEASLVPYETGALIVLTIFLAVVAIKVGYLKADRLKKAAGIGTWIVFAYFVLNTVGNFASGVSLEKLIFGPVTIVMVLLSLRVAVAR